MPRISWKGGTPTAVVGVLLTSVLLVPQPAAAATDAAMSGSAAVTDIDVLNGTVTSGPTSVSSLATPLVDQSSTNRLASVDVPGLAFATTLSTEVETSSIPAGKRVTSTARAAGVKLLGGAIKIRAVETTSSVSLVDGLASYDGDTEILGLTIGTRALPIKVKPNTKIAIPGLAEVVINKVEGENISDAAARVTAVGLEITLLKPVRDAPAGATIRLTPTAAAAGPTGVSEGPLLAGLGHALKASAHVGSAVKALAGPVAAQYLPNGGTAGREVPSATVAAKIPPVATVSALGTTVQGSRQPTGSSGTVTAHAAKVNLLNGLIKADVIDARASASRDVGAVEVTTAGSSELVGLRIGGQAVPVGAPPNTTIDVARLGTVTLNQQIKTSNGLLVRALHVKVSTSGLGLPVGAEIEVAAAHVAVGQ